MTGSNRDLSALTGRGRASGLAGRLPARPAQPPAPEPQPAPEPELEPEPEPEDVPEPEPAEETPMEPASAAPARPRPRKSATRREPERPEPPADGSRKQSWPAYVPGPVLARVRATLSGRTMGEWLLDAYEDVHDQLDERFPRGVKASAAGLPPRTQRPRRSVETAQEVHWRLTGDEISVLEQRRVDLGRSRSEIVTAVCELHLAQLDEDT